MMKKPFLFYIIIAIVIASGILSISSCKRSAVADPEPSGPAGFRIILTGLANPSTMYIPPAQPVSSLISVTALTNDGTPVSNKNVVFHQSEADGYFGYFENYQISDVRTTNSSGTAQITFFIPPLTTLSASTTTHITATLVDDGRLDSGHAQIENQIPVHIIPNVRTEQTYILSGNIYKGTDTGIGEIPVVLESTTGLPAVMVTHPGGRFQFQVTTGWYGSITPQSDVYTFLPPSYSFTEDFPVTADHLDLDFLAISDSVVDDALMLDLKSWTVPVAGGTQVVNVINVGSTDISYIIVPDYNWMSVSPTAGTTPGQFTVYVEENLTGATRSGLITVVATNVSSGDVTLDINQLANEVSDEATLAVDRPTLNFASSGGVETFYVYNSTSSDDIDFFFLNNYTSWISLSDNTGSTDNSYMATVSSNTGEARTGTITITATSTGVLNPTLTITINQDAGGAVAVSPETYSALASGGESFTVYVTNYSNDDLLTWTLTNTESWISVTPVTGNTDGGSFVVTIQSANTATVERTGTIVVTATNTIDGTASTASVKVYQQPTN
ncbi:MAG: BACON domain-containing protein [bacterium]|nr:BACON domain-containing protein [bacterium]